MTAVAFARCVPHGIDRMREPRHRYVKHESTAGYMNRLDNREFT